MLDVGASTRDARGPAFVLFLGTAVWIFGGFAAVLLLGPEDPEAPRMLLGLPLRPGILFWIVGLAPALVVPFVYAGLFDHRTLRAEDLEALRAKTREVAAARERTEGMRGSHGGKDPATGATDGGSGA